MNVRIPIQDGFFRVVPHFSSEKSGSQEREKLRELIESSEFRNQRLLIFTERRDTLEYLRQRFEALGFTGQLSYIHGGMDVEDREKQRIFFMPPPMTWDFGEPNDWRAFRLIPHVP